MENTAVLRSHLGRTGRLTHGGVAEVGYKHVI